MMRSLLLPAFMYSTGLLHAQLEVPVRIQLVGDTEADRQISGLADPISLDAAVSVDALRASSMSFAPASGTQALAAELSPAPLAYTTGMAVTVLPTEANSAGATLELNGLGARPVVKWGSLPLDSADLQAGMPARLVYDGERFLLLNSAYLNCPPGMVPVTRAFCIATDPAPEPADFFAASNACASAGGRLCTMSEWASACRMMPAFLPTVSTMEWVDNAANNARDAKVVGAGWNGNQQVEGTACEYGRSRVPETILSYRCCFSR